MKNVLVLIIATFLFSCKTNQRGQLQPLCKTNYELKQENNDLNNESMQEERLMVYNAVQQLKVKKLEGINDQVAAIGKNHGGYILEISQDRVRFRVPNDSLEIVLTKTGQLGEITEQKIHGKDVTEQHADLTLRLDNAQQSRKRYLQLLDKAETVNEILLIEKELERLLYNIERLQGQINKLDETITFSTVTVTIQEKVRPGPLGWVFVGVYEAAKFLFVWD